MSRLTAVAIGLIATLGIVGPVWANEQSAHRHTAEIAELHRQAGIQEAIQSKEAADINVACSAVRDLQTLFREAVGATAGEALNHLDTSKLQDRQLAAIIDALAMQSRLATPRLNAIVNSHIPCNDPVKP